MIPASLSICAADVPLGKKASVVDSHAPFPPGLKISAKDSPKPRMGSGAVNGEVTGAVSVVDASGVTTGLVIPAAWLADPNVGAPGGGDGRPKDSAVRGAQSEDVLVPGIVICEGGWPPPTACTVASCQGPVTPRVWKVSPTCIPPVVTG